jgi:hypothetical protein
VREHAARAGGTRGHARARGRGVAGREAAGAPGRSYAGAHTEEERGGGGEERGRGELTSGSKSGDHHLQTLGHHREREVGERGSCYARELNEGKRPGEGGAHGGGAGARRPGPGRAGSG